MTNRQSLWKNLLLEDDPLTYLAYADALEEEGRDGEVFRWMGVKRRRPHYYRHDVFGLTLGEGWGYHQSGRGPRTYCQLPGPLWQYLVPRSRYAKYKCPLCWFDTKEKALLTVQEGWGTLSKATKAKCWAKYKVAQ